METDEGLVVVGLDETKSSHGALDFALREGLAHGFRVEVVTAWQWTSPYESLGGGAATPEEASEAAAGYQNSIVDQALSRLAGQPDVTRLVVHDYPAKALLASARDATMLVVGHGRKGSLTRTVLGSVSEYCVRHAVVPVVVVPDPEASPRPRRQRRTAGATSSSPTT